MADGQTYFIILLVLSVTSNFVFPASAIIPAPYSYFGILVAGFGIGIALWSRALFLKGKTTLSPHETPSSLLTSGPFRISRNPIYLGMTSVLLGIAMMLGTLVAFAFPVLFLIIIETLLIPGEEQKMEKIFGERYGAYRRKVRKWI